MANKTTNFNLDLPTGDELFNPLWPNSNTTKIDAQMKKNMDNSVTKADCVFNTNKFLITREDKTGKIFKFIAPNDYVAGYTFTVDGTAMDGIVAGTGDALADGCFMNGHEVIAYIDETTASLAFLVGSSLPDAIDATTLEGHGADYFATAAGLAATNQVATSAGQVANQALEAAQKAGFTLQKILDRQTLSVNDGVSLNIPEGTKMLIVTRQAASSITNIDTGNTFILTDATAIGGGMRTNTYIFSIVGTSLIYYGYAETTWSASSVTGSSNMTGSVSNISVYAAL